MSPILVIIAAGYLAVLVLAALTAIALCRAAALGDEQTREIRRDAESGPDLTVVP